MKKLFMFNLVLVVLLSITAAVPKLLRVPQEVTFFESVGLAGSAVLMFGFVQLAGGILLVFSRARLWGAGVVAVTFLASAIMVFLSGNTAFGLVSILPVLMACIVLRGSTGKGARSHGTTKE